MFRHDRRTDGSIILRDGRSLGYSEFGDPMGYPVLNNHGGLMCRFDVEPAGGAATSLGVRIISPDRPGIGESDPLPGRKTIDWADDVGDLVDALGIGDFATMGWSMGGQYAMAVAHRFGERCRATAVIAGCVPLDHPRHFAELNPMDRRLTRLSVQRPAVARRVFSLMRKLALRFPKRVARVSGRKVCSADRAFTADNADWFAATLTEALGDPSGMVEEYRAWVKPWQFRPRDIAGPVEVWQGSADTLVPRAWAEDLAAEMPRGALRDVEGEGHFIAVTHRGEIMERLLVVAKEARPET